MKPYDVNIVADYIIYRLNSDEKVSLINLKLQKLLYYVQAWSLGIEKERFVDCTFEAWIHGPVCRQLYDRFKASKSLYSNISLDDIELSEKVLDAISDEDKEFVDYILDNYGGFTGIELENMTHREMPWQNARRGLSPMQASSNEISEDDMRRYYGEKWEEIDGDE